MAKMSKGGSVQMEGARGVYVPHIKGRVQLTYMRLLPVVCPLGHRLLDGTRFSVARTRPPPLPVVRLPVLVMPFSLQAVTRPRVCLSDTPALPAPALARPPPPSFLVTLPLCPPF